MNCRPRAYESPALPLSYLATYLVPTIMHAARLSGTEILYLRTPLLSIFAAVKRQGADVTPALSPGNLSLPYATASPTPSSASIWSRRLPNICSAWFTGSGEAMSTPASRSRLME